MERYLVDYTRDGVGCPAVCYCYMEGINSRLVNLSDRYATANPTGVDQEAKAHLSAVRDWANNGCKGVPKCAVRKAIPLRKWDGAVTNCSHLVLKQVIVSETEIKFKGTIILRNPVTNAVWQLLASFGVPEKRLSVWSGNLMKAPVARAEVTLRVRKPDYISAGSADFNNVLMNMKHMCEMARFPFRLSSNGVSISYAGLGVAKGTENPPTITFDVKLGRIRVAGRNDNEMSVARGDTPCNKSEYNKQILVSTVYSNVLLWAFAEVSKKK